MANDDMKKTVGVRRLTPTYVLTPAHVLVGLVAALVTVFGRDSWAADLTRYETKLVASRDENLCPRLHNMYLQDDQIASLGNPEIEKGPMYQLTHALKWASLRMHVQGSQRRSDAEVAEFDINNDGKAERVVRQRYNLSNRQFDELWVFNVSDVPNFSNELQRKDIGRYRGVRFSPQDPYRFLPGDAFSNRDRERDFQVFSIRPNRISPLVVGGTTYLELRETYLHEDEKGWRLIVKYRDEHFPIWREEPNETSDVEYICFFQTQIK